MLAEGRAANGSSLRYQQSRLVPAQAGIQAMEVYDGLDCRFRRNDTADSSIRLKWYLCEI